MKERELDPAALFVADDISPFDELRNRDDGERGSNRRRWRLGRRGAATQ
jgi:hypothetical protein